MRVSLTRSPESHKWYTMAPMTVLEATTFVPARGLENAYVQSLYGIVARRLPVLPVKRERWELPDGDFIDVDLFEPPDGARPRGFLLLVHGLEGSTRSAYIVGMLEKAHARGLLGIAVNLRSCSGEENRLPRSYHSGATDDIALVLRTVEFRYPRLRGAIAGFSLGANIVLKWAAEEGAKPPESIGAVTAVSCPFDLATCASHLDAPRNWWMRARFLQTMRQKALRKAERFPEHFDARAIRAAWTFRSFDEVVTAPIHGYRDAADYWSRASCGAHLGAIRTPTLIISALDDPLIPPAAVPRDCAAGNPAITLLLTERGGHVGFVAGSFFSPVFWAEERAIDFICGQLVV
jgi:uncharacterized protein